MIETVEVVIPYLPRPLQADYHAHRQRWSILACHRRFGKTVMSLCELIACAVDPESRSIPKGTMSGNPRYGYIAPTYKQAKSIAWDYLLEFTRSIPGVKKNESELRVDLPNGSRITLYGADNLESHRGIYLDGVVLDEFGSMNPSIFGEIIRPALSDRLGWATFIGTFKGRNAFWRLYEAHKSDKAWYVRLYKASETGIIQQSELDDARQGMTKAEYDQEYECNPMAALRGAYYADVLAKAEKKGRLTSVPYIASLPVHTAWDLGISDSTSIIFYQVDGQTIKIIDYYENSGEGMDHYIKTVKEKPYIYGFHYAPHDIENREWTSGITRKDAARAHGIEFQTVPKVGVADGINAVRMMFDRIWMDAGSCTRLIDAVRQYRKKWNDKLEEYYDSPVHDWTSHAADAMRYMALSIPEGTGATGFGGVPELEYPNMNRFM